MVRQALNVESGLNDGICVPLLLILLAAATGAASHPVRVVAEEIGYGVLCGAAAALFSAGIVVFAGRRNMIDKTWQQIIPLATTLAAYGAAIALHGSGFIAAFVAGALFGLLASEEVAQAMRFTEETGAVLNGVTFLVFGAVLLGPAFKQMSWRIVVYAVLSLTVVRMLPVAIALLGTHARPMTVVFMGWFGPRGLASIVFAVIVEDAHLPHSAPIATAAYLTVGLSVLVHGLSAAPLVSRYIRWFQATSAESPPVMETEPSHEHRQRFRSDSERYAAEMGRPRVGVGRYRLQRRRISPRVDVGFGFVRQRNRGRSTQNRCGSRRRTRFEPWRRATIQSPLTRPFGWSGQERFPGRWRRVGEALATGSHCGLAPRSIFGLSVTGTRFPSATGFE